MFRSLLFTPLIFSLFIVSAHAQVLSAQDSIAEFLNSIKGINFSQQESLSAREFIDRANGYLDLEALAQKALGKHWEQANEEERNEFLKVLGELIERVAYLRSQEFLGDLTVQYSGEIALSDGVEITSEIIQENAALNAEIIYHVHLKGDSWAIYDIFLDDVSITEDLKYQWDQVIEESSFSGLIEKMQERLEKAKSAVSAEAGS